MENSNTETAPTNEFNSYVSRSAAANSVFGLDIFSLYEADEISSMIENPMEHNESLRRLSSRLYSSNGLYTQCVDYCQSMVTLDYCVVPMGKSKKKRRDNKLIAESALTSFHHKEIMRDALFKSMIDGVAFYYCEFTKPKKDSKKTMSDYEVDTITELNDAGINMSVVPLPVDYVRIVGRKNSSYVLAFNLRYFETATPEELARKLRFYPSEIREGWNNYHNRVTSDSWLILDNKKTITSKIRAKIEEPYGRPLVLAAIKNILYNDYFTDTCRGTLDEVNNRIVYQTLPAGREAGSCALNKNQQEDQHNKVKQAVMTKNDRNSTSFFTVAAGTKIDEIKTDTALLDEKNCTYIQEQIGVDLGFMSNLLSGSGSGNFSSQQNNLQLLLSEVMMWIEPITVEFVKVINENLIKDKKNPIGLYYFPCSYITRKDFVNQMKDLYLQGKGSLRAWIASTGFSADAYLSLMEAESDEGFDERFKPHETSFTISGGVGESGRPKTDNPTESTLIGRDNGGNDLPSPSDIL